MQKMFRVPGVLFV